MVKFACAMKVMIVMLASVADRSIGKNLSMSISVGAREMVNYACERCVGHSDGAS